MARGAEAKQKRKNARKEEREKEAERLANMKNELTFEEEEVDEDKDDNNNDDEEKDTSSSSSSSEEENETTPSNNNPMDPFGTGVTSIKKKIAKGEKKRAAARRAAAKADGGDCFGCAHPGGGGGSGKGIKTAPLVLLLLLTGTTILPAVLYAGDYIGAFVQKHHILGSLGHKLGIGPSPKKRVLSFYEKHDPTKIPDVPKILAKHYGDDNYWRTRK